MVLFQILLDGAEPRDAGLSSSTTALYKSIYLLTYLLIKTVQ